jgi:hypothetical protein
MTLEACTACLLSEIVAGLSRRWCRPSQQQSWPGTLLVGAGSLHLKLENV